MEEIRDVSFNLSRVCRFCLSHSGVMSPIFDRNETLMSNVATKIMAFVRVQGLFNLSRNNLVVPTTSHDSRDCITIQKDVFNLQVNDGLPSMLCHRCLYMAEKSFEFKTQCETSDAMLRKYLSMMQATFSTPMPLDLEENTGNDLYKQQQTSSLTSIISPLKRKRGRPRKEENLIFYSSPTHASPDSEPSAPDEINLVNGIAVAVDPRSDLHSNSDEDFKKDVTEACEKDTQDLDTARSLAIARAKAKKYMGVVISTDENGVKTRRHLCKGCGKTFGHCSDLRKHVLVHTGERPFHCQLCDKTFSRSTNLNKHLKVHSGQKPFSCAECPKSFASKGDLQRHQVIHSGIKPFRCNLCHQCFSRKDKLTRHVKLHGSPLSVRVNSYRAGWTGHNIGITECETEIEPEKVDFDELAGDESDKIGDEDGESSEEPTELVKGSFEDENDNKCRDHVESMVINIDPFPMDGDTTESALIGDIKAEPNRQISDNDVSNDMASLLCPYCTQSFPSASTLAAHVLSHAEKPHKCELCAKSFSRRRELLRHETVHTGVKPFSCQICLKAFARKDKLARHKKIHDVRKPPQRLFCELCAVAFFNESLFKEHMDSHDVGDNSVEFISEEEHQLPKNGCVDSEECNSDEEMEEPEPFLCLPLHQV